MSSGVMRGLRMPCWAKSEPAQTIMTNRRIAPYVNRHIIYRFAPAETAAVIQASIASFTQVGIGRCARGHSRLKWKRSAIPTLWNINGYYFTGKGDLWIASE